MASAEPFHSKKQRKKKKKSCKKGGGEVTMAIVVVDRLSPFSFIPQPSPLFFSSSSPSMPITFRFPSPPLFPSLLHLPGRQTRRPRTDLSANAVLVVDLLGALVDPWAPNVDSQSIASQLFAASLLPYLGFLYHLTKSNTAPKLTLFGFYFLLAFVGATVPAGIYAKVHYGTSLSNVDWLHGGAESLLTITNLCIVLGLRKAIRDAKNKSKLELEEEIPTLSK